MDLKDNSIALRVWAIAKYITATVLWSRTSVRILLQIYGSTDGKSTMFIDHETEGSELYIRPQVSILHS